MTRRYGGFFGRSAFSAILEHMLKVLDCTDFLMELIERFLGEDHEGLKVLSQRISKLEHDADVIKEELRLSFSKSVLSVVNRSDMLALIKNQDHISDGCEHLAKLMSIRKTTVHEELREPFLALAAKAHDAVQALKAVEEAIDSSQDDSAKIEEMIRVVGVREWEADQLELKFMKRLFALESQIDPVSLLLLRDMARMVGGLADSAENVGDSIRRIMAK